MRKLPAVLATVVLFMLSVFSANTAVDVSVEADSSKNTQVIRASINIKSDTEISSGRFALRFDNSKGLFRGVSSPDFYAETSVSDNVVNIVVASKAKSGVNNGRMNLEFDRLATGDFALSFDVAECVDNLKRNCSVVSDGIVITLTDDVVDKNAQQDYIIDSRASNDSLTIQSGTENSHKYLCLFICGLVAITVIVVLLVKEQKELRQSK